MKLVIEIEENDDQPLAVLTRRLEEWKDRDVQFQGFRARVVGRAHPVNQYMPGETSLAVIAPVGS